MILSCCSYCRVTFNPRPGVGITHTFCPECYAVLQGYIDAGNFPTWDEVLQARGLDGVGYRMRGAEVDLRLPACQRSGGL